jgi:hypothetical protein
MDLAKQLHVFRSLYASKSSRLNRFKFVLPHSIFGQCVNHRKLSFLQRIQRCYAFPESFPKCWPITVSTGTLGSLHNLALQLREVCERATYHTTRATRDLTRITELVARGSCLVPGRMCCTGGPAFFLFFLCIF